MDSIALLAVTQTVSVFGTFLPKVQDVRKASPTDPDAVANLRSGEFAAAMITITVGAICCHMAKDIKPLILALIIVAIELAVYERILKEN